MIILNSFYMVKGCIILPLIEKISFDYMTIPHVVSYCIKFDKPRMPLQRGEEITKSRK